VQAVKGKQWRPPVKALLFARRDHLPPKQASINSSEMFESPKQFVDVAAALQSDGACQSHIARRPRPIRQVGK